MGAVNENLQRPVGPEPQSLPQPARPEPQSLPQPARPESQNLLQPARPEHPPVQRPVGPGPLRLLFEGTAGLPLLVIVDGEIDYANAFSMQIRIAAACRGQQARGLIMDISRVEFMASCGLGAILNLQREYACRRGGLVLCGARAAVRRALALTGLDRRVVLAETIAQAERLLLFTAAGADIS
jgi:anti-sigma B factor antagonist